MRDYLLGPFIGGSRLRPEKVRRERRTFARVEGLTTGATRFTGRALVKTPSATAPNPGGRAA